MSEDIKKLSKRQLLELVEQLQAEQGTGETPVKAETDSRVDELIAQNQKLMAALVAERRSAQAARSAVEANAGQELHDVVNLLSKTLGLHVTDERGVKRHYLLEEKGSKVLLSAAQLTELNRERPELFKNGMLSAPTFFTEANPNVITNINEFLHDLDFDEISRRINQITSVEVLYQIYHTIESKRWATEDDSGRPFVDAEGLPEAREVELPAKMELVIQAVAKRLKAVANINLDLQGSD